jgi:integrase
VNNQNLHSHLSAQIHVIFDKVGSGESARALRRPLLVDRVSGLLHELPTTYVFRTLGQKALNTQVTVMYDLAFYLQWLDLRRQRSPSWLTPEQRVRAGKPALTEREIADLRTWCQTSARGLVNAFQREAKNIRILQSGETVESTTTNSRLINIRSYLQWLTRGLIEGVIYLEDREISKSIRHQEILGLAFANVMHAGKKAPQCNSLTRDQSNSLRRVLVHSNFFSKSPEGKRDQLIARLLHEAGLRAGELLKLRCEDLEANFRLSSGKTSAIVRIIRRPNDINDERLNEPSVKTLPGPVTISKDLAAQLILYISHERRQAIELRKNDHETPYLFVCHTGPTIGKPISRRNLNRIIKKLQKIAGLRSVSPHVLRHTHFTDLWEMASLKGKSAAEIRAVMLLRGHWSPNSKMPERYASRHLANIDAEYIEERDRLLEPTRDF